jgi:hypothetical protein
MGLFFESETVNLGPVPLLVASFRAALLTNPVDVGNEAAITARATQIVTGLAPQVQVQTRKFRIWRFIGAVVFLALIFVAAVYCARDDKLQALSQVLVHGFEVLLGAVIGIVIGESSAT